MDFKNLLKYSYITFLISTVVDCLNNGIFTEFVPGLTFIQCFDGSFSSIKCRPGHKFNDCAFGYQCETAHYERYAGHSYCGVCCPAPPVCPYGIRSGPYCGPFGKCPLGYNCFNGICCQEKKVTCPSGTFLAGKCNYKNKCRPGFFCFDGACCSLPKPITIKIDSCPVYYVQLRGLWCSKHHHCPGRATCVNHQCCHPNMPLPRSTPTPTEPPFPRPTWPNPVTKRPPLPPTKPPVLPTEPPPLPEPKPEPEPKLPIKPIDPPPGKINPPTIPPTVPSKPTNPPILPTKPPPTEPPKIPALPPTQSTLPTVPPTPPTLPPKPPTLEPTVPAIMPPIFPPINPLPPVVPPVLPPVLPPVVPPVIPPSCPADMVLFPEIKCDSTNICPGNTECISGFCCGYKAPPPIVPKSVAHCPLGQDRIEGSMCNVLNLCPAGSQCVSGICCTMTIPKPEPTEPPLIIPEKKVIPLKKAPVPVIPPPPQRKPEIPPVIPTKPEPPILPPPQALIPPEIPPKPLLPPATPPPQPTCPIGYEPLLGSMCDTMVACPVGSDCISGICCALIRPPVDKCPASFESKPCPVIPESDQCTMKEDCGPFLTCCETSCGQRVCKLNIDPLSSEPRK